MRITKTLTTIGLISIFYTIQSCKRTEESFSTKNSGKTQTESALFVGEEGIEEAATELLNDFWAHYAAFLGVEYESPITVNLDATVSLPNALATIHYALNVGLVRPDSVYEDIHEDSTYIDIEADNENEVLTKTQICEVVNTATPIIKQSVNSISGDKALNRLDIKSDVISPTIRRIKIRWSISHGLIFSVSDLQSYPNSATTRFTTPIPRLSKKTTLNGDYNEFMKGNQKYFTYVLLGIPEADTPTAAELNTTWNRLPNGNAAHHRLSNRNIYWPDPHAQINGWHPINNAYTVPVKSPKWVTVVNPGNKEVETYILVNSTNISDQLRQVTTLDLTNCSNPARPAPNSADFELDDDMVPSGLPGWYKSEANYNLTQVRNITANAMNFFWQNKINAVSLSQNRANDRILQKMSDLKSGFYALSDIEYTLNDSLAGACQFTVCEGNDLCPHKLDYAVWNTFSHYTILPRTPQQLVVYF
jgi:hypothetical protein